MGVIGLEDLGDFTGEKAVGAADPEGVRVISLSFVCDECNYQWQVRREIGARDIEEIEEGAADGDSLCCPMCGCASVTQK